MDERYRIGAEIGEGGTGQVFEASDSRSGDRVAIKRLRRELAEDSGLRAEFAYEARSASDLRHPGIVKIHAVEEDVQGLAVVMERTPEGSLADRLASGQTLDPSVAIQLAEKIGRALSAVHRSGLRHGNLKPGNILLDGDQPKLTDFGTARLALQDPLTRQLVGTDYLAPELLGDEPLGKLDRRSDVYGLAACLYAALTGESPRSGAGWRVPDHLRELLQRSLSDNPDERPRNVDVFLEELEQASLKEPGLGRAKLFAGLIFLLLVGGVIAAVALMSGGDEDKPQSAAVEQAEPAVAAAGGEDPTPDAAEPAAAEPGADDGAAELAAAGGALQEPAGEATAELDAIHVVETRTGNGYALGFVTNTGALPIEKPRVELEFFDDRDRSLTKAFSYSSFDLLEPGERSPIKILLKPYPEGWSRYESELKVRGLYMPRKRLAEVALVDQKLTRSPSGFSLEAQVEVRNDEPVALEFIEAVVVLYDAQQRPLEIASGYVKDRPLEPGAQGRAEVHLLPHGNTPPSHWQVFLDASLVPD